MASDILRTHIVAERLQQINDYYMRGENLLRNDSTIDREAYWQQFFSFVGPRAKYLTDNLLLMIAGDEFFFNRIEFQQFRPLQRRVMVFMPFDYDPKTAEMIAQEKQVYSREFNRSAMNELHDKLHISPTD